jgi:hypothetical protein
MWAINLQLLLLRQAIHKLPGLISHHHHHCNLLIPKASIQKGTSTPNSNATSGRSPKLVQSTSLYQNQSTHTEQYTTSEILLSFTPFYFLYEKQVMKTIVLISCNDSACTRMKYIFFTDSRSIKVVPKGMQSRKLTKLQKAVPKGAQRKFSAQKSFLRECIAKIDKATKSRS